MPGNAFYKAFIGAASTTGTKPDFSYQYARMGREYAWASPDYIRDRLTEPQLHGYLQHLGPMHEHGIRSAIALFLPAFWKYVVLPLFGKGK